MSLLLLVLPLSWGAGSILAGLCPSAHVAEGISAPGAATAVPGLAPRAVPSAADSWLPKIRREESHPQCLPSCPALAQHSRAVSHQNQTDGDF